MYDFSLLEHISRKHMELTVSSKEALSCSVVFESLCGENVLVWMLCDLVKAGLYLSISRPITLKLHLKSKSNVQMTVFIFHDYLFSHCSYFFYCCKHLCIIFEFSSILFLSRLQSREEKVI